MRWVGAQARGARGRKCESPPRILLVRPGSDWHPLQNSNSNNSNSNLFAGAFGVRSLHGSLAVEAVSGLWIKSIHRNAQETMLVSPPSYWLQLIKRLSLIFVPEETQAGFSVSLQLLSAPPASACPSVPPKPSLMQLSG